MIRIGKSAKPAAEKPAAELAISKAYQDRIWRSLVEEARRNGPSPDDHPSVRVRLRQELVRIALTTNAVLTHLPRPSILWKLVTVGLGVLMLVAAGGVAGAARPCTKDPT